MVAPLPLRATSAVAIVLAAPALVCGCASVTRASARYTGPAPACGGIEGGGTTSTLTRLGGGFAFAPYDGVLVVEGKVAPDGSLSGTLELHPAQPPAEPGAAKPPPSAPQFLTVRGRISGETTTVDYTAPGCTASLTLTQVHPPLF